MTSGINIAPTLGAVLTWTRMFSPTVVNEVRLGYTRIGIDEGIPIDWCGQLGADGNSKFGIAGGQPIARSQFAGDGSGSPASGSGASIGSTGDNKLQYGDNLTWQGVSTCSRWAARPCASARIAITPATTAHSGSSLMTAPTPGRLSATSC